MNKQSARLEGLAISIASAWVAAGCTTAGPEQQAAAHLENLCSACHGHDGNSVSARSPVVAGQGAGYIVAQLNAFRDHSRADHDAAAFMWPMAAGLTDPAIADLTKYFASLPAPPGVAGQQAADVANGKALYQAGLPARGVPPCSGCHGDKGQGTATFPRLAGQHEDYLKAQIAAFADGSRASPIMGPMAKNLSPADPQSLAAFLSAL